MTHGIQMIGTGFSQGATAGRQVGSTQPEQTQIRAPKHYTPSSVSTGRATSIDDLLATVGFSPELVLFIAKKRMEDIDGQVRASMSELQDTQAESKALGEKIQGLRELQEHLAATGEGGVYVEPRSTDKPHNFVEAEGAERTAAVDILRKHGVEIGSDVKTSWRDGRRTVQGETIKSAIENLEEQQQELNTGNELGMVKLQSLMQQRTQILTLTTNLLQKLDEGTQSIIRNLA